MGDIDDIWLYGLIDLNPTKKELGDFTSLYDVWNAKREGNLFPSKRSFDFTDFKGWHGRILIDEVEYSPFDLKCVLCGVEAGEWLGGDQTSKAISSFATEAVDAKFYSDYMNYQKKAVEEHKILRCSGPMFHKHKTFGLDQIGLPCGEGDTITHLITALVQKEADIANTVQYKGELITH